ncbi:unnamed protein product [Phytophthora fragariaefolia]|uniref:Unnamed protein product n=1 Tax=Phytophthora fragariaefolia TaxID=1490495 RepID=A0A9W6TQE9_9STRA|nr:unnamed protein product [Phytophthora fragariaefolia]
MCTSRKDMVVVTTKLIQNVETLNVVQNVQLKAQLKREDPELWKAVEDRETAAKQKETNHATRAGKKGGKKSGKKKKSKRKAPGKAAEPAEGAGGDDPEGASETADAEAAVESGVRRMTTRHMDAKHVPVAMEEEIGALENNQTWELVKKPDRVKVLHSKGVDKTKKHADGSVERYKGRLVACNNEQSYGVDYTDMFSAVLDMTTGKVIFALALIWGVPARHGDVPNAYVKTDKEKNLQIYLYAPQGMEISKAKLVELGAQHKRELVLRLKKGMYGLKQAGQLWNQLLHCVLTKLGYTQSYTDSCLGRAAAEWGRWEPAAADRADIPVVGRQSVVDRPLHQAGHRVCSAPGGPTPSFAAPRRLAACQEDRALLEGHPRLRLRDSGPPEGEIAGEVVLKAYCDADYAGDRVDRKSVSGGVLLVGGMMVGWLCKKQTSISLSSMEAEFVAASEVTAEMLGIAELLKEIDVKTKGVYDLKVDNQAAIKQIKGEDTSGRAKHIDISYKFVKDLAHKEALDAAYCESKEMWADIPTKAPPAPRLEELHGLVMPQE